MMANGGRVRPGLCKGNYVQYVKINICTKGFLAESNCLIKLLYVDIYQTIS